MYIMYSQLGVHLFQDPSAIGWSVPPVPLEWYFRLSSFLRSSSFLRLSLFFRSSSFWGRLHFWGCVHFWGHLYFRGFLYFWGCLHFWGHLQFWSHLHFEVVFSIYSMSRSNLLFTASKSDLKHLRWKFWVWHCSAKLKTLSWISMVTESLSEANISTNHKPWKKDLNHKDTQIDMYVCPVPTSLVLDKNHIRVKPNCTWLEVVLRLGLCFGNFEPCWLLSPLPLGFMDNT